MAMSVHCSVASNEPLLKINQQPRKPFEGERAMVCKENISGTVWDMKTP
jgi:hypothetical protein